MNKVLIVGAGLHGATVARLCKDAGLDVFVMEKDSRAGGMAKDSFVGSINVHENGAHIFHTKHDDVWEFVNRFQTFNHYVHRVKANYGNRIFSMPFNMKTYRQIWPSVETMADVKMIIDKEIEQASIKSIDNLEQLCISLVGTTIYRLLVKGYTEKQWGKSCDELNPAIIKRLPMRWDDNDRYFSDKYEGIPTTSYSDMINRMLSGIRVNYNVRMDDVKRTISEDTVVVYTGSIDELFDYKYGCLGYRSLRFEHNLLFVNTSTENSVVNYTSKDIPFTRTIEHKLFTGTTCDYTIVTKEYPERWTFSKPRYYPCDDEENQAKFSHYKAMLPPNIILGGRIGEYKYYDMDQTIKSAFENFKIIRSKL